MRDEARLSYMRPSPRRRPRTGYRREVDGRLAGRRRTLITALLLAAAACGKTPAAPEPAPPPPPAPQAAPAPAPIPVRKPKDHDEELVWAGVDAFRRRDGVAAAAAFEEALRGGSKDDSVDWTARGWLPIAYALAGDLDKAVRRADELTTGAPREVAMILGETRADLECARGDPDAAIRLYRDLVRSMTPKERSTGGIPYTVVLSVELKLRLLGRELPEIEPVWIEGAEQFDTTQRVAVLSYLSPFEPPNGQPPILERLRAFGPEVAVAAVASTDADENLPWNPEIETGPQKSTIPTQRAAANWRRAQKATFPIVGVAPDRFPEGATLFACNVLVGRDGRVAYVGTAGDSDGILEEIVVRRLLARR